MADILRQVPYIGPIYNLVDGPVWEPSPVLDSVLKGQPLPPSQRTRFPGLPASVTPIMGPRESAPSLGIGALNDGLAQALAPWVFQMQENAGLTRPPPNVPQPPPALPEPDLSPLPPQRVPLPDPIQVVPELPEVVVSPPSPAPAPAPSAPPNLDVPLEPVIVSPPVPNVGPIRAPAPGARPGSAPAARGAPGVDPVLAGSLLQWLSPGLDPVSSAIRDRAFDLARPAPSVPRPGAPTTPGVEPRLPIGDQIPGVPRSPEIPGIGRNPLIDPTFIAAPQPSAELDPEEDPCDCKKSKKREPRPPRAVCYQGTYKQRSKGISYSRGKEIPCEAGPVPKRETGRSRKPKDMGDLARDVFNIPSFI